MRGPASRHPPWAYAASHLPDTVVAVQIDQIDRESHEERMHRLAGNYPQSFARQKAFPPQQTLPARWPCMRGFEPRSQHRAACHVQNPQRPLKGRRRPRRKEFPQGLYDPLQRTHPLASEFWRIRRQQLLLLRRSHPRARAAAPARVHALSSAGAESARGRLDHQRLLWLHAFNQLLHWN